MANAKASSKATLNNRRLAAEAILQGFADGDVGTVLTTARAAGYKDNTLTEAEVGGIINGVNR
jgi:hypothetical protein